MEVPVVIAGGGVMGLAVARALGRKGVQCAVVDPLPRRTERNASNDESKVFRLAYADRADYTALAQESLAGWQAMGKQAGRTLLHNHGILLLGREPGGFADRTEATLKRMGIDAPRLEGKALDAKHPAFAGAGYSHAVLDPHGGLLEPPAILETLEADAVAHRAKVFRDQRITDIAPAEDGSGVLVCRAQDSYLGDVELRADRVVVATGYRSAALLPELAKVLHTSRQPEFLFEPADPAPYAPARMPVFGSFGPEGDGFYGFPLHRGAVKVADHRKGPVEPQTGCAPFEPTFDAPTPAEEAVVRGWMRKGMPGLADAPLARSRVCYYDNTPDDDPLVGPHPARPGVLLAVGFSGHGFKFAPAVGEAVAGMVLGEEPAKTWAAMDPARLLG